MAKYSRTLVIVARVFIAMTTCSHILKASPIDNDYDVQQRSDGQKLIYILLDGFRWDYLEKLSKHELPGFNQIIQHGVRAKWLDPIFPTVSVPTWTSLATGVFTDKHGIPDNHIYDAKSGKIFTLTNLTTTADPMWWTYEPIWITATKAGVRTALHRWARCDVPYDGVTADYCGPFIITEDKEIFFQYIQEAVIQLEQQGYDLIQIYSNQPDWSGHNNGPDSEEVKEEIKRLDDALLFFLNEIKRKKLDDNVNIIIVSDHGMAVTVDDPEHQFELDNYLNVSLVDKIIGMGGFINFKVPSKNIEEVYNQLSEIPKTTVYRKKDIPEEWHFKHGKYVQDIMLVTEEGYYVRQSKSDKSIPERSPDWKPRKGDHRYDPKNQNMKGIFFAIGPMFEKNKIIEPVHVEDVYQALTNVLNINPIMNDGSWARMEEAFKPEYRELKPAIAAASVVGHPSIYLLVSLIIMFEFLV